MQKNELGKHKEQRNALKREKVEGTTMTKIVGNDHSGKELGAERLYE